MVFSSIPFIFFYLPIVLALYYLVPFKYKNALLLAFSLVFYAWGEPVYIVIMLIDILVNYVAGLLISKKALRHSRLWLVLAVTISLALLGFYKYAGFILEQINLIPGISITVPDITLPIGISFFTFQSLSYSVDVYRGTVKAEKSIVAFAAYVSMFPQLIAGPIVRYSTVSEQLHHREINFQGFSMGTMRFLRGLFKKVLIADTLGLLWNTLSADISSLSVLSAWLGVIAFTLQLYFDFSGYSDMAIGMGHMMGFTFEENFNYPLAAVSVTDFWRRWHISLSGWFRDYVYIPLGGNRCGKARHICNLLIVWGLTGLWHGAAWNYIFWGLYYGVLLVMEKYLWGKYLEKLPRFVGHIYTLLIVVVGFEFFVFEDFGQLITYLGRMFGGAPLIDDTLLYYMMSFGAVLTAACLLAAPVAPKVRDRVIAAKNPVQITVCNAALSVGYILLFILSVAAMVNSSYSPFLYFRF